jgi:hypothetical protein
MNRVFCSIWDEVSQTCVAVSERTRGRGKGKSLQRAVRSRWSIAVAAIVLSPTFISQAFAQCSLSATGGTIGGAVINGCTITGAGSTVTVLGSGRYDGWLNFTGINSFLIIDPGGAIRLLASPCGKRDPQFHYCQCHWLEPDQRRNDFDGL